MSVTLLPAGILANCSAAGCPAVTTNRVDGAPLCLDCQARCAPIAHVSEGNNTMEALLELEMDTRCCQNCRRVVRIGDACSCEIVRAQHVKRVLAAHANQATFDPHYDDHPYVGPPYEPASCEASFQAFQDAAHAAKIKILGTIVSVALMVLGCWACREILMIGYPR